MKRPDRALVLCAGFGQRMHPLTCNIPKPLMPLWGLPNLTHILTSLQAWGIRDVLLNVHHVPDPLLQYARACPVAGMRLDLSFEADILGTGGALQNAKWFMRDKPIWVANADILMDLKPTPMLRALDCPRTIASVWVDDRSGPRTVECSGNRVKTFRSPHAGRNGTYTFCGVQIVRPELLHYLPASGFSSIVEGYERAMQAGHHIHAHCDARSHWCDLGTPEGTLRGHIKIWKARHSKDGLGRMLPAEQNTRRKALRAQGATLKGVVSLGKNCRAASGALLENVVLLDGVEIGRNAHVHNAIVGHDVPAGTTVTRLFSGLGPKPSPAVQQSLLALHWPQEDVCAEQLAPRGSSRTFTRLRRDRTSAILVEYDPKRIENTRYASHARFLSQQGIRVPRVLCDDPSRHFTLFEDLGTQSLAEHLSKRSGPNRWDLYGPVVETTANWHRKLVAKALKGVSLEAPFDASLYAWEHELFCGHYLRDTLACTSTKIGKIRAELTRLSETLLEHPTCLVHRDLQSTNVYLLGPAKSPEVAVIDFQGMRLGAAHYDLASLLADPYVNMPRPIQEHWVRHYADLRDMDATSAQRDFWTASAQRLVQAIGAFARNATSPSTAYFAQYIPAALHMLHRAMVQLDNSPHLLDFTGKHAKALCATRGNKELS